MTWLFVKMYPTGSTMTPEPLDRGSSRGRRLKYRSKNSSPKNSRKRCGSSGAPAAGRLERVLTLTTDGVTRSATALKASSIACSTARASIVGLGGLAGGRLSAAGGREGADWAQAGAASAATRRRVSAVFMNVRGRILLAAVGLRQHD